MQMIDRTELFKKYQNQWVALTDDDKIICNGISLDDVLRKSKKKGIDNPVTAKMPDLKYEFIF